MEEVKYKDLKVGEKYLGYSSTEHTILATYKCPHTGNYRAVTCRILDCGKKFVSTCCEEIEVFYKKPLSLADKFMRFRSARGSGSGKNYWLGLEEIAKDHFKEVISLTK